MKEGESDFDVLRSLAKREIKDNMEIVGSIRAREFHERKLWEENEERRREEESRRRLLEEQNRRRYRAEMEERERQRKLTRAREEGETFNAVNGYILEKIAVERDTRTMYQGYGEEQKAMLRTLCIYKGYNVWTFEEAARAVKFALNDLKKKYMDQLNPKQQERFLYLTLTTEFMTRNSP